MNTLIKINDWIIKITKAIAITAFLVMLCSSTLQVIARFILNVPVPWTDELSRYAFVWSTTLGISIFMRGRKHSSVDLLENILPDKYKKYLFVVIDVLCISFYIIMILGGTRMVKVTIHQISPSLSIPMGLMYLSIPLSAIIMSFMTAENFLKLFLNKEGGQKQ